MATQKTAGQWYEDYTIECAKNNELQSDLDKATAENEKLRAAHWADLNSIRQVLLSRTDDLSALVTDIHREELQIKKSLTESSPCPSPERSSRGH